MSTAVRIRDVFVSASASHDRKYVNRSIEGSRLLTSALVAWKH